MVIFFYLVYQVALQICIFLLAMHETDWFPTASKHIFFTSCCHQSEQSYFNLHVLMTSKCEQVFFIYYLRHTCVRHLMFHEWIANCYIRTLSNELTFLHQFEVWPSCMCNILFVKTFSIDHSSILVLYVFVCVYRMFLITVVFVICVDSFGFCY